MTVKELIKELEKYEPSTQIYASSDEEGNSYHPSLEITMTELDDNNVSLVIYPLNTKDVIL